MSYHPGDVPPTYRSVPQMPTFRIGLAILAITASSAYAQPAKPASSAQGKIVAVNGRVEHTPAAEEAWSAARVQQPLLVAERVRTLEASRASILFIDETQVKLNARRRA